MNQILNLDTLAWIVGCLNPLSALLVGPALAGWINRTASPQRAAKLTSRAAGLGWLLLALGQTAFLAYGWVSGHNGFRWAQAAMIPIAAANFAAWHLTRRRARQLAQLIAGGPEDGQPAYTTREDTDPVDAMMDAIAAAQDAGRIRVEHRVDIGPGIPLANSPLHATALRITPLDQHGQPTGTPRDITGRVTIGRHRHHDPDDTAELDNIAQHFRIPRELLTTSTQPDTSYIQPHQAQPKTVNPDPDPQQPLETPRTPCPQPIYGPSLSAPVPCAFEEGHGGDCAP